MSLFTNSMQNPNNSTEQPKKHSLVHLIESVSNNKLSLYYPEHNSAFIKKIDKLNLSFYIETEKILSRKKGPSTESQGQDTLFLLLFKQINLYISEIERLNVLIKEFDEKVIVIKNEAKEEKMTRRTEINTKDQIINTLRTSNTILEAQLLEQIKRSNTLFPFSCSKMPLNKGFKIETFYICFISTGNRLKHNQKIIAKGNSNDSIIMNGGNAQSNQKKQMNYFDIGYNPKEEKPNETNRKKIGEFNQKKKGMKIIKSVKMQYSQIKVDSIEVHSSERETNGRINSDITDCNNTIYIKSQRMKQRRLLLDSCKTQYKY